MNIEIYHELLVEAEDFDAAQHKVQRFFEKNFLVRYDAVIILEEQSLSAEHQGFFERIEAATAANRQFLKEQLSELANINVKTVEALNRLPQGFESKTLHTAAHMLDGFFGIDTCFYNLEEESHWLSDKAEEDIRRRPGRYWLIKVEALSGKDSDRLSLIRSFKVSPK